jgi:hypothetical protein
MIIVHAVSKDIWDMTADSEYYGNAIFILPEARPQ